MIQQKNVLGSLNIPRSQMVFGVRGRDIEKVWALVMSLGAVGGARPILSW